jgi:hypothetical protein
MVSNPTREEIGDLLRRLVDTAVEMKNRAEQAEAQLAKAREDALREAADLFPEADISDDILALLDTPTPAPSPDDWRTQSTKSEDGYNG